MGSVISEPHRYAAFISYAHADEAMAARLHKALEIYPVPKFLRAQGKATKPVFRDVAELTAAHSLSEKIKEAVRDSRVLIVLCSPAAKASHWVNEEIRLFRELHGDAAILSAIIEGTPETAFPEALTEGGREPLAAALGADKAGFKLGVTQLAAAMLETGLDNLIQREAKRRNRILRAGLAASLIFSGAMGFTTHQAVDARNEAELERSQSEALLDYMVKDLKENLEPHGRLELLEGVGRKAIQYYDKRDIVEMSDDNLRLLAAAYQIIAQVDLDKGKTEEAQKNIEAAAELTKEILNRNPEDADAIFAHGQSEFWRGNYYFRSGQFSQIEPFWLEYVRLQQSAYESDPNNFQYIMEAAYSANALGAFYDRMRNFENSKVHHELAKKYFLKAIEHSPQNPEPVSALANILSGKARAALKIESYHAVAAIRDEQLKLYEKTIAKNPHDKNLVHDYNLAKFRYYVDVLRFSKDTQSDLLNQIIRSLVELIQFEPDNKKWLESVVSAKFFRLDKNYRQGKISEYSKNFRELETILADYSLTKDNLSRYQFFRYELAKVQFMNLKGDTDAARRKLSEMTLMNEEDKFEKKDGLEVDAYLMIMNFELGHTDIAEKLAKKYLSYPYVKEVEQGPAILEYKIHAHHILKECNAAESSAMKLSSRNFHPTVSLSQNLCD